MLATMSISTLFTNSFVSRSRRSASGLARAIWSVRPSAPLPLRISSFDRVREDYEEFIKVVTQVIELIRSGKGAEGRTLQIARANPLAERLERLTNELVNRVEIDMVASIETNQEAYVASRRVVIGFALGSIGLALTLGYALSWSLIGPVKEMDTRLRQIAAGDFSRSVSWSRTGTNWGRSPPTSTA